MKEVEGDKEKIIKDLEDEIGKFIPTIAKYSAFFIIVLYWPDIHWKKNICCAMNLTWLLDRIRTSSINEIK
jgi:hypothetical protein